MTGHSGCLARTKRDALHFSAVGGLQVCDMLPLNDVLDSDPSGADVERVADAWRRAEQ